MATLGRASDAIVTASEARAGDLVAAVAAAHAARAAGEDRVVELGRYRLLRTLGRGGMGQVFEAWDTRLERHVALKLVLRGGLPATLGEARCLARLAHPNVVSVHEVGEIDGFVYLAMELVDGPNLRRWVADRAGERERGWAEILDAILAAGRGLAAVHGAGLLHGDVKPSNVLVGRDGRVRVADFGLARLDLGVAVTPGSRLGVDARRSTTNELDAVVLRALNAVEHGMAARPGEPADGGADSHGSGSSGSGALEDTRSPAALGLGGTLAYMAPERLAGGPGGAAADQYSLCATAWETLFGALPRGNDLEVTRARARGCPVEVIEVLRRGLAAAAEDRWPSIDALCAELEAARDRPIRRAAQRRWVVSAALLASLIPLGALALTQLANPARTCEQAQHSLGEQWTPARRALIERRFAASDLPLAQTEARFVGDRLDAWVVEWSSLWRRACVAEPSVRSCLERERGRFDAVVALLDGVGAGDQVDVPSVGRALVTELGSPLVCLDRGRTPGLGVAGLTRLAELSSIERRIELAVLAGAYARAQQQLARFDVILAELGDRPGVARSAGAAAGGADHREGIDARELAQRRLAVEPWRARVLVASGRASEARARLRAGIREAEARAHDGLRFALLLAQASVDEGASPSLDELAALEGLAERLEPGPVARAQLSLLRAGVGGLDGRLLIAELAAASSALGNRRQPHRYGLLRFELALRRAQLHFDLGELSAARAATSEALTIAEAARLPERTPWAVIAALQLAATSAARHADCAALATVVESLWAVSERAKRTLVSQPQPAVSARRADLPAGSSWISARTGMGIPAPDWETIRRVCPDEGSDLAALFDEAALGLR